MRALAGKPIEPMDLFKNKEATLSEASKIQKIVFATLSRAYLSYF
jgi:hypothetical protein